MKSACCLSLVAATLLFAVVPARADVVRLTPLRSQVLPVDETGTTRVALLFSLGELRQGDGREIAEALLDWRVVGIPAERVSTYRVYALPHPWTEGGVDTTGLSAVIAGDPQDEWVFTPMDFERNQGGLIRLDLSTLASHWAAGTTPNQGIVVTIRDVSAGGIAGQLEKVRLTIRYGFIGNLHLGNPEP